MHVQVFDSWDEALEEMEESMQAADSRVQPWQTIIKPGDYVVSPCEGDLAFSEVLEDYTEERMKHFRFVRSYSVFVPDGELGDLHISQVIGVLSQEAFAEAQSNGWQLPSDDGDGGAT